MIKVGLSSYLNITPCFLKTPGLSFFMKKWYLSIEWIRKHRRVIRENASHPLPSVPLPRVTHWHFLACPFRQRLCICNTVGVCACGCVWFFFYEARLDYFFTLFCTVMCLHSVVFGSCFLSVFFLQNKHGIYGHSISYSRKGVCALLSHRTGVQH